MEYDIAYSEINKITASWSNIISDVLQHLVLFLPISSFTKISLVCKHWSSIFSHSTFWKNLYNFYDWPIGPYVESLATDPQCSWREICRKTYEITNLSQILSVAYHQDEVWRCSWDLKGRFFITSGKEGLVVKWDVQYDEENGFPKNIEIFELSKVNHPITSHNIHPSGDFLTFNTNDDYLQFLDINNKSEFQEIPSSPWGFYGIWVSDTTFLVSQQKRTRNPQRLIQNFVLFQKFDGTSSTILMSLNLKYCWVQTTGIIGPEKFLVAIAGKYGEPDQLCISKKGINSIVPSSEILKKKDIFDVYTMPGVILGWTKSPDENYILFNMCKYENENYLEILKENDEPDFSPFLNLCLFNVTTRQIDRIYSGHSSNISQQFLVWPEFGWKNLFFLTGSDDGKIYIYHRDLENPFQIIDAHDKLVNQIIYHPTKNILISVSDDCTTKMWVPKNMARGEITFKVNS